MGDKTKGLYDKFRVSRVDGSDAPGGKHHGCRYYVLDIDHDRFAIAAINAYARACKPHYPFLADDLESLVGIEDDPRDRRIAELEAALKEVDKWYITEQKKFGDPPTIDKTPTLDALLAQARREALTRCIDIAKGCEDYGGGYEGEHLDAYHHGMQTVQRCLMQLRDGDESLQLRMVESAGRRIAELEAQVAGHPAALAAAKQEALEAAIERLEFAANGYKQIASNYSGSADQSIWLRHDAFAEGVTHASNRLRRMAREVKP